MVAYLRKRFETEPELQRVRHQVEILHQSVADIPGEAQFDYIISAVPLTRLPADVAEAIFDSFRRLLKPGGTFTFLEYKFLRSLRKFTKTEETADFIRVDKMMKDFINRYQFRSDSVMLNVPAGQCSQSALFRAHSGGGRRCATARELSESWGRIGPTLDFPAKPSTWWPDSELWRPGWLTRAASGGPSRPPWRPEPHGFIAIPTARF
jgi:SAM-dependent methyltransferase